MRKQGLDVLTDSMVKRIEQTDSGVIVHIETPDDDDLCVPADRVLVSIGIVGNTEGLGLEAAAQLERDGISVEVIDVRSMRPFDLDTIVGSVRKTAAVRDGCFQ